MIKSEYFASPVYVEEKPDWVDKIDNICEPYIKNARDTQKEAMEKRKVEFQRLLQITQIQ